MNAIKGNIEDFRLTLFFPIDLVLPKQFWHDERLLCRCADQWMNGEQDKDQSRKITYQIFTGWKCKYKRKTRK